MVSMLRPFCIKPFSFKLCSIFYVFAGEKKKEETVSMSAIESNFSPKYSKTETYRFTTPTSKLKGVELFWIILFIKSKVDQPFQQAAMYDCPYFNETKLAHSARGISTWEHARQVGRQTETGCGGNVH